MSLSFSLVHQAKRTHAARQSAAKRVAADEEQVPRDCQAGENEIN